MEIEIPKLFGIRIFTHFFIVSNPTSRIMGVIYKFCNRYVMQSYVERGRINPNKALRVFASKTKDNSEFRFHIGQYKEFIELLEYNYVTKDMYTVEYEPLYTPTTIDIKTNPNIILRDYQEKAVDFILNSDDTDNRSRFIGIQTGQGKTTISLFAAAETKSRVVILILPKYIDKWSGDVVHNLQVNPKEVVRIQGSDQLRGLISQAVNNQLTAKFIIISLVTMQNYFDSYETNHFNIADDGFECIPQDLYKTLDVGTLIIDETHQHIHSVYKALVYSHIPKVIALSATLITDDIFIQKIHKAMFPREARFDKLPIDKYVKVKAIAYSYYDLKSAGIRTSTRGSTTYSHTEYEKTLMRNYNRLKNYLKLIKDTVDIAYINDYILEDKLIIFAGSIKMCEMITNYLKQAYPNLDVRRFVENDPYENIIEPDIRVTTILSGGTAMDIPNLRVAINTISIQSPVANLQSLGRLRKLKDRDVKFYYLYCDQIKKHVDYHRNKMMLFYDRAESIKEFKSLTLI